MALSCVEPVFYLLVNIHNSEVKTRDSLPQQKVRQPKRETTAMSNLAIDQTGNGYYSFGMELTMMSISLGDGFVTTHATNEPIPNKVVALLRPFVSSIFFCGPNKPHCC